MLVIPAKAGIQLFGADKRAGSQPSLG